MWRITNNDLACLKNQRGIEEFVAKLGYKTSPLPRTDIPFTDKWRALLAGDVIEISRQDQFIFFHIPLKSDKFRRTDLRGIINHFYIHLPQNDYLFFFTSQTPGEVALVCPKMLLRDQKPVFILRTLVLNPDAPYRTDLEILNQIALEGKPSWERIDEAFDVERVTAKFFQDFQGELGKIETALNRMTGNKDEEWAHLYALRLLSRIMFLYFIQRKRWLNNDSRFIRNFYSSYKSQRGKKDNFHRDWLNVLFFSAFNKQWEVLNSQALQDRFPPEILNFLKNAPYLNGGLFIEDKLDEKAENLSAFLPDEIFDELIYRDGEPGFFERYNFTIAENTPLDQEVAVDPEMIGKVYESLVFKGSEEEKGRGREGRRAGGIFYTPRVEIDLMCRLSLVDYLSNNSDIPKRLLYQWVFAFSEEEKERVDRMLSQSDKEKLWETILDIKVLDPACGSGSFLVGMLLVLDDLLRRLEANLGLERQPYERRKESIKNSLYGVDLMSWAVEVAELRLWLQLIIETEIDSPSSLEPLLPNLSYNIRQGDSLIQKISNWTFHPKSLSRHSSANIKSDIKSIKDEKSRYYKGGSRQEEEKIKSMERQLLLKLISDSKISLQQEIQNIRAKLREKKLFPIEGHKMREIVDLEREEEEKEKELEELMSVEEKVKEEEKEIFFIWDVAFPEAFERGGFDIVIGNPPYIRQEKINDIVKLKGVPSYTRLISNYKQELMDGLISLYPYFFKKRKMDARSDLYIYFYLYCLSLLSEKGSFCFITSNSWLDVGFGRVLQEFLLRHSEIKMLIDNSARRSFSQALIDTVIVLLSPPKEKEEREKLARFVRFKVPFEEILAKELGEARAIPFWEIEETKREEERQEFLCRVRRQEDLLREGIDEKGEYRRGKWGGRYLRAPNICFTILEKGRDKLVRLGDIAEIRLGFITGANEFFYLKELGREEGIVRVRNKVGWEGEIEEGCLKPLVKSLKELRSVKGDKIFQLKVLYVQEPPQRLKRLYPLAYEYVRWGEGKGYQNKLACRERRYWYSLGKNPPGDMILSQFYGDRYLVPLNEGFLVDAVFYNLYLKSSIPEDEIVLLLFLNSSLFPLLTEIYGRIVAGLVALTVYEFEMMEVIASCQLSPGERKAFLDFYAQREDFLLRPIKSIFEELGFPKPNKDYSNIDVDDFSMDKLLPDRRELDEIVFSVLGLNEKEKNEFYKAVVQLVKNRLSKAKSV